MTDQENNRHDLHYAVHDALGDFYTTVKLIARMTANRLIMIRAVYPELFGNYQDKIALAYELSIHDCLSQKEAGIAALQEAQKWLENYGGSPQRKKRGLEMIEQGIKHLKGEINNEYRT